MPTASTGWTELPVCPVTVRVPPGAPGPGSARVTACTIGTAAPTPGVRSTVERTLSSRPPRDVAPTTRRGADPATCDAKSAKERDTLVVVTATDTTRATPAAAATAPRTVRTGCRTSLRRLSRRNRRISASGHVAVAQVQHPPCPPGGALVVGRHEQGGPDLEHLGHQDVEHLLAGRRVEVAGRLVGEEQARTGDQRPGDGGTLHLAPRELSGQVAGPLREPDLGDGVGHGAICAPSVEEQRERDVLGHRERRDEVEELEDEADLLPPQPGPLADAQSPQVAAVERDQTVVGLVDPAGQVQQG